MYVCMYTKTWVNDAIITAADIVKEIVASAEFDSTTK